MRIETNNKAIKLLKSIGDIDDSYIDEAEVADVAAKIAKRKRVVKYSAIGAAAASVGITTAVLLLRSRRARTRTITTVIESIPEFA